MKTIICKGLGILLEIQKFLLMNLMKNSFCFNKRLKKFCKLEKVLPCKLFSSLDYPYILDYKEVLLTTPSTSRIAYQSLLLWFMGLRKKFSLQKKNSHKKKVLRNTIKILAAKEKFSEQKKNPDNKWKILTAKEQLSQHHKIFSRQKKNSHNKRKILTAKAEFSRQTNNFHNIIKILRTK